MTGSCEGKNINTVKHTYKLHFKTRLFIVSLILVGHVQHPCIKLIICFFYQQGVN